MSFTYDESITSLEQVLPHLENGVELLDLSFTPLRSLDGIGLLPPSVVSLDLGGCTKLTDIRDLRNAPKTLTYVNLSFVNSECLDQFAESVPPSIQAVGARRTKVFAVPRHVSVLGVLNPWRYHAAGEGN